MFDSSKTFPSVYFIGTYAPIMCGIADYTGFITREMPPGKCGVLTFDLKRFEGRLTLDGFDPAIAIWYGITDFDHYTPRDISDGLFRIGANGLNSIAWFQHEHGIWRDDDRFVGLLKEVDFPKVVTLHTVHFERDETPSGLCLAQYLFLKKLLPNVDAITVFSRGAYLAVATAFPQYREKVFVLKHGIPSHSLISNMSRQEARSRLHEYLVKESDLNVESKKALCRNNILTDPDSFIIGECGFLCPGKQSGLMYSVRDRLADKAQQRKVIALRIGAARNADQVEYVTELLQEANGVDKLLLQTCLPEEMLRLAQKAFDVNFYWPEFCTQSGILAHALGAGAVVVGKDMEGSGEMLKEAGAITARELDAVVGELIHLMHHPERSAQIEKQVLQYAERYSWKNQAVRHFELGKRIAEKNMIKAGKAASFATRLNTVNSLYREAGVKVA